MDTGLVGSVINALPIDRMIGAPTPSNDYGANTSK